MAKLSPKGDRLVYSTFLGGSRNDRAHDVAVDAEGFAYVTGGTDSADFPVTAGAADGTGAGATRIMGAGLEVLGEAFLAKLSRDGTSLAYSTLLGGADPDDALAVQVDGSGAAYVAGHTFSPDFPTTAKGIDRALNTETTAPE